MRRSDHRELGRGSAGRLFGSVGRWILAVVAVLTLSALTLEGFFVAREQHRQTCLQTLQMKVQAAQLAYGLPGADLSYKPRAARTLVRAFDRDIAKCTR